MQTQELSPGRKIIERFSPATAIKNQKADILNLMETTPSVEKIKQHINYIQNHEMGERVRLRAYFEMVEKKYPQENIDSLKNKMGEWALSYVRGAEMMNLRDDWSNELKKVRESGHPNVITVQKIFGNKIKDTIQSSGDMLDKPDECIELCNKILKLEKSESRKVLFQEANALLMNCHHTDDSEVINEIKSNNLIIKDWFDEALEESNNSSSEESLKQYPLNIKYIDNNGKTKYLSTGFEKISITNFYRRNLLINLHIYNQIPVDDISYIVNGLKDHDFNPISACYLGVFYDASSQKSTLNQVMTQGIFGTQLYRYEKLLSKEAGKEFVKHIKDNNKLMEINWYEKIFSEICDSKQFASPRTKKLEEL